LEQIADKHNRLWVSYGAIHWADPEYSVSRWFAENTYRVFQRAGLVLYLPSPESSEDAQMDMDLGPRLRLLKVTLDRREAQVGDFIRVGLDFDGDNLGNTLGLTIGLLDEQGNVWQQDNTHFGPVHQLHNTVLPRYWRELRGMLFMPGLPPGQYTLAMKIRGRGTDTTSVANTQGWIPLSVLDIVPGAVGPNLLSLLPYSPDAKTAYGETLTLVGIEPYAENVMQGYPTGFQLWWRAEKPVMANAVNIRLLGPETWESGMYPLGPDFYPSRTWEAGDVIRQSIFFLLPDQLSAGTYRMQIQVVNGEEGTIQNSWFDIFSFKVEARKRDYSPPLVRIRQDVRFGDVLRLRGYRLERKSVLPGESVTLTVYWQAVEAPSKIYAVFNHLRDYDSISLWQGDSWPQEGIYTTDHWMKNEVVAESTTIEIPGDTPPGDYPLFTGVYDPVTGTRLTAVSKHGERYQNDEILLFNLKVEP
jgi:hypothetical protein